MAPDLPTSDPLRDIALMRGSLNAAIDRIAALEADLAKARQDLAFIHDTAKAFYEKAGVAESLEAKHPALVVQQAAAEIICLRADLARVTKERDALREDAGRYRWMCNNALGMDSIADADSDNMVQVWSGVDPALCFYGKTLDEAIDAARKEGT